MHYATKRIPAAEIEPGMRVMTKGRTVGYRTIVEAKAGRTNMTLTYKVPTGPRVRPNTTATQTRKLVEMVEIVVVNLVKAS